ncbi:MAG: DoxX family protein [Candidatus Binatia bacterium]
MIFPELTALSDIALFALRLLMAILFGTSGWLHATRSTERAESVGLSPRATVALGVAELVCAVSLALGIYQQLGALVLIAIMLGAIQKKVIVWKLGFWGDRGEGWFYDLLYLACNLVILTTGGGAIALT